ncbi:MAG TPA: glycosyltransferase family A protein [Flavitalea sp.]|nr:glycosyltransferase family A protein [Flavitalea sp.]
MEQPFISFCITTYKRQYYLHKTLVSISLQTYSNFEVVVSDNDVEQTAREVVENFKDNRFKYFPNEANLGMKKSFNRSLQRSSGNYIVMIADDDPVYPDMLSTLIELSEKYPSYGMFLGGCNWFCTHPGIASLYSLKVGMNSCLANKEINTTIAYSPSEFLKNFFNFKIFPSYLWSTCMVKREILIEKGGVPDYGTAFLGDYAYLSIMASHSGCVVINYPLGHQTIHEQNFGRAQNEQIGKAAVNFIEYVSEKIKHVDDWPVIESQLKHFVALWVLTHLAFLKRYYSLTGNQEGADLRKYENDIFILPLMKKYRLKYFLKTNMPVVHDYIVKRRRTMSLKHP